MYILFAFGNTGSTHRSEGFLMYRTVKKVKKSKKEKNYLISYEWDLDKISISESDLISKHPEIELILRSLTWNEKFFLRVGSPGSIITIESNWTPT